MADVIPLPGFVNVVSEGALQQYEAQQAEMRALAETQKQPDMTGLAHHIRSQFDYFKRHRDSGSGWSDRLLAALRTFKGEYSPERLAEIRKFGGSDVYARITAMKCRGASAMLRDIYLAPERSWGIGAPADPDVPQEVTAKIQALVMQEVQYLAEHGQPVDPGMIRDRMKQLTDAARQVEKKNARKRAERAEDMMDEILNDGGFYEALAEVIVDLPLFPFACMKGPVVRVVPTVSWGGGTPRTENKPRMFWNRISPFDVWWTPGASSIADAAVIERTRLTRADLNDLLDLPGYNHEAIRTILDDYGRGGLAENWDSTDSERAEQENREDPRHNHSGMISCLEYHGSVQGRMLLEFGFTAEQVPDPLRDYMVQAWLIGRHVIKVQLSPSPRKRHPYYITSFEKVPGTPVGNGLPDILEDIQSVANATLRSLVNNLSVSSGPQVVVNDDQLAPGEDGDELYPWKRWHTQSDPVAGQQARPPVDFFQPNSNAQELLAVYQKFTEYADELSAIPKYLSGQGAGGAGRTAAGLAMLMGNASKVLQTVAANIDRDIMHEALMGLYEMLMLTDQSGVLKGDESVRVMGVNVAMQRETERARQLEFLQITANPLDQQIMGLPGRAKVLRSVSQTIGLDGEGIVPDDETLMAQAQQLQAAAQAQGGQESQDVTKDQGPRVNITGGAG